MICYDAALKAGYEAIKSKAHKSALTAQLNKMHGVSNIDMCGNELYAGVITGALGEQGTFVLKRWYLSTLCLKLLVQNHIHFP